MNIFKNHLVAIYFIVILILSLFAPVISAYPHEETHSNVEMPWPMLHGNPQHTSLSMYDTSNNSGKLKWELKMEYPTFSSPVIGINNTIYTVSIDFNVLLLANKLPGTLKAIGSDVKEKWNYNINNASILSTPAISPSQIIYLGDGDGFLHAINRDGSLKWKFQTEGAIQSSPTIGDNETIYVGSRDKYLYAINPDGTQKWKFFTGDYVYSSASIGLDGTIFTCSNDTLFAIHPYGTLKWSYEIESICKSSPVIDMNGLIYVSSYFGDLYSIYPNGTVKWIYECKGYINSAPSISPNGLIHIIICKEEGESTRWYIYTFTPDGTIKWTYKGISPAMWEPSSPVIDKNGNLFIAPFGNKLYAIDFNGSMKWSFQIPDYQVGYITTSLAIGYNGTIYFGNFNSYLYAIGNPPLDNNQSEEDNDKPENSIVPIYLSTSIIFSIIIIIYIVIFWKKKRI